MPAPPPTPDAALAAAASPNWQVRERAGEELVRWADRAEVSDALVRLLLDPEDTSVTVGTLTALLGRNDVAAIRPLARAVVLAGDVEPIDDLYGTFDLGDCGGPAAGRFVDACERLAADPDPTTRAGAAILLEWARAWT